MSHEATSWAVKLRGLKPTAKVILWHLADRHNPDHGCFPSQARLAYDAEVSRATLNRHLDDLEAMGLIRRIRSIDPRTKRQNATRYVLAFEDGFSGDDGALDPASDDLPEADESDGTDEEQADKPCLNLRHGAVSQKTAKPCLIRSDSRVSNCDTNLVREPLREPVRTAADSAAVDKSGPDSQAEHLDASAAFWAEKINARAFVPSSAITARIARLMVSKGLVTWDQLRTAGIAA